MRLGILCQLTVSLVPRLCTYAGHTHTHTHTHTGGHAADDRYRGIEQGDAGDERLSPNMALAEGQLLVVHTGSEVSGGMAATLVRGLLPWEWANVDASGSKPHADTVVLNVVLCSIPAGRAGRYHSRKVGPVR